MSRFRSACALLLGAASGAAVVGAFRPPLASQPALVPRVANNAKRNPRPLARPAPFAAPLRLSDTGGDADVAEGVESLDADLAREIEDALSLAQDALAAPLEDAPPDEEDIDEIASMLLERPPVAKPPPLPVPPREEPPASIVTSALEEGTEGDGEDVSPPPPEETPDLGESLRKKAAEEVEKLKATLFGLKEELGEAEADAAEAEDAVTALKKEIEESLKKREELMAQIEREAAAEKELMVAQMETASSELAEIVEQSAQSVTDAKAKAGGGEQDLLARIESFKAAIDGITSEIMEVNIAKEGIQTSRQSMLDKVVAEGKGRLAQFQKSFQFDLDYAKQANADLARRADEAEGKVRGVYEEISDMRSKRVSLQQNIVDVEKHALEEIATLERELKLDDERYAARLEEERERLDKVIDAAFQAYAIKVCKKIVEREAVEADCDEKLEKIRVQIAAVKAKQEAKVKESLDRWEAEHKKERIALYQEKYEKVSAVRKRMNAELEVEYAKIEETHQTMRAKIDAVHEQTAAVKAEFEKELATKRQLAKNEEKELLSQIEGVRVDMTDKIKTQRRLYDDKKSAYLEDMNGQISDAETEVRQRWRDLAVVKQSYREASEKKDGIIDSVAGQDALIDAYESDRKSFRKSLRLTARVAREKIGTKTKRLLKREGQKEKAP
ncbi:hypothetical protein ACHAXT_004551 [Thalassiosira profunda]